MKVKEEIDSDFEEDEFVVRRRNKRKRTRIKREYNSDEDDDEDEDDDDFDGRKRYGSSSNSYRRKFRNKLTRDEWKGDNLIKCTKCDKVK